MTTSSETTVAVTARTEYIPPRVRALSIAGFACLVAALLSLLLLRGVGVHPTTTAVIVAAFVAAGLILPALGGAVGPGAVVLGIDDDTVYVGSERHGLVTYALSDVRSVENVERATVTAPMTGRDLRIAGLEVIAVGFVPSPTDPSLDRSPLPPQGDDALDIWLVPVATGDPAAASVIRSLRRRNPRRSATSRVARPDPDPTDMEETSGHVPASTGPRVADAGSEEAAERLWEEATRRHDRVLGDYGAYEMAPETMMRFPAVTDITRAEVQAFHEALDNATALRTDVYPGSRGRADAYQQAVGALRAAWIRCETTGRAAGTDYLDRADADALVTARKLYIHAQSSSVPDEQATYFGRARDIVATLTERGALHPPQPAIDELHAVTRRAIEAKRP